MPQACSKDSCGNCFQNGCCARDEQDGMGLLRRKMLEADLLIIGSPVFAGYGEPLLDELSPHHPFFKTAAEKACLALIGELPPTTPMQEGIFADRQQQKRYPFKLI